MERTCCNLWGLVESGGSRQLHFCLQQELSLREPARFTINGLRYLLVKFEDVLIPPTTEEIFRRFMERGICPVITHPERNPVLQRSFERLQRWTQMGCLLQVTAPCLTDRFGKVARHRHGSCCEEVLYTWWRATDTIPTIVPRGWTWLAKFSRGRWRRRRGPAAGRIPRPSLPVNPCGAPLRSFAALQN